MIGKSHISLWVEGYVCRIQLEIILIWGRGSCGFSCRVVGVYSTRQMCIQATHRLNFLSHLPKSGQTVSPEHCISRANLHLARDRQWLSRLVTLEDSEFTWILEFSRDLKFWGLRLEYKWPSHILRKKIYIVLHNSPQIYSQGKAIHGELDF